MDFDLTEAFANAFDFILFLLPVVVPILLVVLITHLWIDYKRKQYMNKLEWRLLEIFPPGEVKKSPAAMELFLVALHQTGKEASWWDKYIKGQFRAWFSLELVSLEGKIKFFIRCQKNFKTYIESQLYAQFPGIEINEAEKDYASGFTYGETDHELFGIELGLTKDDPYPIKTYIDYNLDNEQDDDYRVDPITPIIEFFNTLEKGNHAWIQILVRAHRKEDLDPKKLFPSLSKKVDAWDEKAKEEVTKIRGEGFLEMELDTLDENGVPRKVKGRAETTGQKDTIAALERSVSKFSFDVGVRLMYIAEKEHFNGINIGGLIGSFKQYNSANLNGFKPSYFTAYDDFPWQDPFKRKEKKMRYEILEAYKDRQYFWKDGYKKWGHFFLSSASRKHFVLNTEELATIFHFPGRVSQAPSLATVDSKKGAPPGDLPI
jgi:hypothetical protein